MIRLALLAAALCLLATCGGTGSADPTETLATATEPPTATEAPTASPATAASPTPSAKPRLQLDGTEWIVTEIRGEPVAPEFIARFRFVNGINISADIACDGAGTSYRLDGSQITLTERIERTHFRCDSETDPRGESEALFDAWEDIHTFQATEERLEFFDADGASLFALDRFLPPPLDPALEGDWNVTELHGKPPIAGVLLSLQIGYEGIGGYSGCNEFGGQRSPLADNALAVEGMFTTDEGCPEDPPGLTEQEQSLQTAIGAAAEYEIDGNTLALLDERGEVTVRFERVPDLDMDPADLIGTSWRLVRMAGTAPPEDAGITLTFDSATEMSGFAGCRDYSATYVADGDNIRPTSFGMDTIDCERSEDYQLLESEFTSLLGNARRWELSGVWLTMIDRGGNVLVFVRDES